MAIALFFLSVILHEVTHYVVAKHFGAEVEFKWIPSKEKKAIGIFGYLPGVRMAKEEISVRECKWMLLSPFPVGIITHFSILVVALFPQLIERSQGSQLFILGTMVLIAVLSSYFASSSDFRDYKKHKTLMLGDTT